MNAAQALLGPALAQGLGDSPALLCGDAATTYAELDAASGRFAAALAGLGVGRGDRVLMLVGDRPAFFTVYLGVLKAGAVAVALNLRATPADLAFAVDDSAPRLLVLDRRFVGLFDAAVAEMATAPRTIVTDGAPGHDSLDDITAGGGTCAPVPVDPGEAAFWMYTSGTTGRPKAAIHCHGAAAAADRFLGGVLGVGPGDRVFCTSKLFFAYALGHCVLASLRLGATTVLHDDWPTPEAVAEVVARHRPDIVLSVPAFYRNLLDAGVAEGAAFRGVRHYVSAGEKLPEVLFERWRGLTGVPIVEAIGTTETRLLFLANRADEQRPGSCGRPLEHTEVALRDEAGAPVTAPGTPGIGWVRTDCLATGYWRRDEQTAAAFQDGWYRTGDVFIMDADGWYYHQGRSDDMLKISGQWVSPAEVEAVVLEHADVADAAVVGTPDRDGLVRLALFVIAPGAAGEALEEALRTALLARLAVYKCPRRIYFIDDMPRTPSGKVRRVVLRDMALDLALDLAVGPG